MTKALCTPAVAQVKMLGLVLKAKKELDAVRGMANEDDNDVARCILVASDIIEEACTWLNYNFLEFQRTELDDAIYNAESVLRGAMAVAPDTDYAEIAKDAIAYLSEVHSILDKPRGFWPRDVAQVEDAARAEPPMTPNRDVLQLLWQMVMDHACNAPVADVESEGGISKVIVGLNAMRPFIDEVTA